jgi:Holliday junction resolvase RusA-like endonuclease
MTAELALWDAPADVEAVTFTVAGLPIPQGSARAFVAPAKKGVVGAKPRAILATDSNRPSTPIGAWRTAIQTEAQRAMGDRPLLAGALGVEVAFTMRRPKSHYRSDGVTLKRDAPRWHTGRGDLDKLERALLDGMTAVVFKDDGQVAALQASKPYGEHPGCIVTVRPL